MKSAQTLNTNLTVHEKDAENLDKTSFSLPTNTQHSLLLNHDEGPTKVKKPLANGYYIKEKSDSLNVPKVEKNHSNLSLGVNVKPLTPFDKLVQALNSDHRIKWELAYGKRIGFYSLKGEIGAGNFSKVKIGMHSLTKEKVAIKILDKMKMDQKTKRLLSREISSMEKLHHPNIVRLIEVMHTKTKLYLVMEYACGGELFSRLSSQGKMSESDARNIFSQILSAVEHMHQHNIIHRDLKAENVFYSDRRIVKVGDFGFSTKVHGSQDALDTFCGSPPYAAPELFRDSFYYGEYVDVWALGILLYFTVTGTMPFRAETVGKLKKRILSGQFTVPHHVSQECKNLIRSILKLVPAQRLSVEKIRKSTWFTETVFPSATSFFKLYPTEVVRRQAQPEEAYALYMLDRLGVHENYMRQVLSKNEYSEESLFSWNTESDDAMQNEKSERNAKLYFGNAIVGTYRILLLRGHKKLQESSKEETQKLSAITKHITGTDLLSDGSIRLCDLCTNTVAICHEGAKILSSNENNRTIRLEEGNHEEDLSRVQTFTNTKKRNQRNKSLTVNSKFCVLL